MNKTALAGLFCLAISGGAIAASPRMFVSPGSSDQLIIEAPPGTRVHLADSGTDLGTVCTDASGKATLSLAALSAGPHTVRATRWGIGEPIIDPFHFAVPARPAIHLAPTASLATGIHASFVARGSLYGRGEDLILGSSAGVSMIHFQDGEPGIPREVDRRLYRVEGFVPSAVAVIDANGDGLDDLAIASSDGRIAVLLNRGSGNFSRARYAAAGAHPASIAVGDFNHDGIPDLAIANQDGNDISILLGSGDGVFKAAIRIPTGYAPHAVVAVDFNDDGVMDLATANFASNDVSVLLGDGHGGFGPPASFAAGHGPVSLVATDFNADGAPDLAIFNQIDGTLTAMLNDGSARFEVRVPAAHDAFVIAGDLDGDGLPDLVGHSGQEVRVDSGKGDGSFGRGYSFLSTASPLLLAAFDRMIVAIDLDGELIVFTATPEKPGAREVIQDLNNTVLNPLGSTPATTDIRASAASILFGQPVTITALVTPGTANGSVTFFDGATLLGTRPLINGVASMSTTSLATGNRSIKALYSGSSIFGGSASPVVTIKVTTVPSVGLDTFTGSSNSYGSYAVAIGDVNGDGKADLIVANSGWYPSYTGSASVYLGNGNGTFQKPTTYPTAAGSCFVALGDINGDGAPELIVVNWSGSVSVLGNRGDGSFFGARNYAVGNTPYSLALGDFNDDGALDIAVANSGGNSVSLLLGSGTGNFSTASSMPVGNSPESILVGDFNGDGRADLAVTSSAGVSVLLGTGNANFQLPRTYAAGSNPYSVASADFNGDGKPDLAVANLDSGNVSILLGNGDGTFQNAVNYPAGVNSESLDIGDFNADGVADLVVANFGPSSGTGGNISVLHGNSNGTFQAPVTYPAAGTPFFVAAGNLNGDGVADVAVIDLNGSRVGVMLGKPIALAASQLKFSSVPTSTMAGSPVTVAVQVQDINGNLVSGSTVPITLTSSPAGISSSLNATSGVATFSTLNFPASGSYTLTATAPGVTSAMSTVTVVSTPMATISGRVTASGVGLSGTTINVNGSLATTTTTDAAGNYSISVLLGGTYTIAPSRIGYSFGGPITFSNVTANQSANFAGNVITGLQFYPVTPCRIADTRMEAGFTGQFGPPALAAGTTRTFSVPSSPCGIPANAGAYALNFTALPKGPLGLVTTWPTGQPMPNTSTLNSYTGVVTANAAIVPAGTGGAINVFVNNTTDLLFDITGYFAPPEASGLQFYPVAPCRIADTRVAAGFPGPFGPPAMVPGVARSFPVTASSCGIPANAAAYSLNFTVIPPSALGVLTAWPTGRPMPNASTLNSYAGVVLANAAIVPAGDNGAISVYVNNATDMVFDINGYFAPPQASGLNYYPVTPCRIADTRSAAGFTGLFGPASLVAGTERSFPVSSSVCQIPAAAGAYSLNFTVVPAGPVGVLTTWPTGSSRPNASTLNSYNGTVVSNAAIVPSGNNGGISVYVNNPTDMLFDVSGYFAK